MAQITFQGNPVTTAGALPEVGTKAPALCLATTDLADVGLNDYAGKTIVLNVFPSIDTPVCAASVRRFNQEASAMANTVVLCISADLPFAHGRFCEAEGLEDVVPLSTFRSPSFGTDYGLVIQGGALDGLMSRAIVVIDASGTVTYTEQVSEVTNEPNYDAVTAALA